MGRRSVSHPVNQYGCCNVLPKHRSGGAKGDFPDLPEVRSGTAKGDFPDLTEGRSGTAKGDFPDLPKHRSGRSLLSNVSSTWF
ncbi:hypothetical protein AVEN_198725-1 [Araneus ventricosus]|uniref:Uncharacterized protein n=1 Tax=Araneus ventricosus TaxID=182803 RepID=A0A4Y2NLA0_ARAVE|nr:hypothetical protein AVEN_198725-1 [Araneus ventricosus]